MGNPKKSTYDGFAELSAELRGNGVLLVTLNRPETLNAWNEALIAELSTLWERIAKDEALRVIVITGAGQAFSVGGDIDMLETFSKDVDKSVASSRAYARVLRQLLDCDIPIIAAINGDLLGGGLGLALHCDVALMSDKARLKAGAQMNINVVSGPEVYLWPLMCSPMKARYHLFKSDFIDAQQAEQLGLVSAVVPHDRLMEEAIEFAGRLAARDKMTVAWTKRACNHWLEAARPLLDMYLAMEGLMFPRKEAADGLAWMRETLKEDR